MEEIPGAVQQPVHPAAPRLGHHLAAHAAVRRRRLHRLRHRHRRHRRVRAGVPLREDPRAHVRSPAARLQVPQVRKSASDFFYSLTLY